MAGPLTEGLPLPPRPRPMWARHDRSRDAGPGHVGSRTASRATMGREALVTEDLSFTGEPVAIVGAARRLCRQLDRLACMRFQ